MRTLRRIYDSLAYRLGRAARGGGLPVPESALDEEYRRGNWDHFFSEQELPRNEALVEHLRAVHGKPRVLDVGCGSGRFLSLLNPNWVNEYLGIDLSTEGLTRAEAVNPGFARFEHADFETWESAETWDVIVFNETLGYARDPASVAAAFAACLNPGGRILVSYFRSGNYAAMWRRLERSFEVVRASTVTAAPDRTWDVKTLAVTPRNAPNEFAV